jgi:DNA-binding transcriptional LysR family regulator
MLRKIDWESQIGRRFSFRDLHVFFAVVQRGSMAKAAAQLGVSTSTVSEVIAALEGGIGVQLLDRSPQGVQPTMYGQALLKRGIAAFDELRQGIRDIEFLADPASGVLRIGCPEANAAILPSIIERFSRQYPRVVLQVDEMSSGTLGQPELRERKFDLVLARLRAPPFEDQLNDDLSIEALFDDSLVVAVGPSSQWARRRKIDIAELVDEPWIVAAPESWIYRVLSDAFLSRGLTMPRINLMTFSVLLRTSMIASGHFITAFPSSVVRLNANRFSLKVLPIQLPARPWPFVIVTLKNRALSPVAERFIEHLRDFTRPMRESETIQRGSKA